MGIWSRRFTGDLRGATRFSACSATGSACSSRAKEVAFISPVASSLLKRTGAALSRDGGLSFLRSAVLERAEEYVRCRDQRMEPASHRLFGPGRNHPNPIRPLRQLRVRVKHAVRVGQSIASGNCVHLPSCLNKPCSAPYIALVQAELQEPDCVSTLPEAICV